MSALSSIQTAIFTPILPIIIHDSMHSVPLSLLLPLAIVKALPISLLNSLFRSRVPSPSPPCSHSHSSLAFGPAFWYWKWNCALSPLSPSCFAFILPSTTLPVRPPHHLNNLWHPSAGKSTGVQKKK